MVLFISIFKMRRSKLENYQAIFFGGEFNRVCPPITGEPKLRYYEAMEPFMTECTAQSTVSSQYIPRYK